LKEFFSSVKSIERHVERIHLFQQGEDLHQAVPAAGAKTAIRERKKDVQTNRLPGLEIPTACKIL
jgi:hypothetical protein